MPVVTDLSELGWTDARAGALPVGCEPARVSRVDRGRLSVLTADGERRVHPGGALYDASGLSGPAVGDWVALRGGLAVAVLPRTSAFVRTVAGRTSAAQVVAANLDQVFVVDALTGEARRRRGVRGGGAARRGAAAPGGAVPGGRVEQRCDAGRRPHQGRPRGRRRRDRRAG